MLPSLDNLQDAPFSFQRIPFSIMPLLQYTNIRFLGSALLAQCVDALHIHGCSCELFCYGTPKTFQRPYHEIATCLKPNQLCGYSTTDIAMINSKCVLVCHIPICSSCSLFIKPVARGGSNDPPPPPTLKGSWSAYVVRVPACEASGPDANCPPPPPPPPPSLVPRPS